MQNHSDYRGETGGWEFGYGSEEFNPEMADQEYLDEIRRSQVPLRPRPGFGGRPPGRGVRPPLTGYRPPRPAIRGGGVRRPWGPLPAPPEPSGALPDEPVEPQGDLLRWVQDSLNRVMHLRLPLDGALGPETRSALRNFQKRAGLPMTGIVDPGVERALLDAVEALKTELTGREWEEETPGVGEGLVLWVQQSLNRILGLRLVVDGIMGPKTRSAIRSFQRRSRLKVDGIVGPITKAALIKAGAAPPPIASLPPSPPGAVPGKPADIVSVRGISVASQISPQIEGLLAKAEADGITLGGWGYRSRESQIALRRKHCGTSDYDIYQKAASQCHPPTAPPGRSMHEKGLAIDFTFTGKTIDSHDNPGFLWLRNNAAQFGLFNLPSEPWHWSVNGR